VKIAQKLGMSVAAAALIGSSVFAMPVSAQGRSAGCTQEAVGGNTNPGRGPSGQGQQQNSQQTLVGVISAAIADVAVLNNIDASLTNIAQNVQVVCLNDALNQNDVRILNDLLAGSTILSNDLNGSLNHNNVLNNLLQKANISLLDQARIVSVDLLSGNVYVLNQ